MDYQTLRGSCACGRNAYVVQIPPKQEQLAELRYDNTSATRHHSAAPVALWLRVPLAWFRSATFPQFPDETRSSIKRTFVSPFASSTQRQFCGYCGTQLTSWNERTRDEADHICLTVGSLFDEDQEVLEQLGFFPGDSSDEETVTRTLPVRDSQVVEHTLLSPVTRGAPWFEELVKNTKLGQMKQQRGGHSSADGSVKVEWEIVEWTEGDDADDESTKSPPAAKRKHREYEVDTEMRTV